MSTRRNVLFLSLFFGLASAVFPAMSYGQLLNGPVRPPISVRVSLPSGGTVMRGEPIDLKCVFTNVADEKFTVALEDHLAWAAFELRDEKGVASSWRPTIRRRAGVHQTAENKYDLSAPVVVREFIPPDLTDVPEGNYTLHVRTKVRYAPSRFAQSSYFWDVVKLAEEELSVPLTVTPVNADAMRDRVSRLYRAILKEGDDAKRTSLYFELAHMPPAFAARTWRTLLQSKEIDAYAFADALSSVVTKEVVDTLIYVQFTNPIRDREGKIRTLVNLLNGMASSTTPEMTRYIDGEIRKHHGSIFNAPIIID